MGEMSNKNGTTATGISMLSHRNAGSLINTDLIFRSGYENDKTILIYSCKTVNTMISIKTICLIS